MSLHYVRMSREDIILCIDGLDLLDKVEGAQQLAFSLRLVLEEIDEEEQE